MGIDQLRLDKPSNEAGGVKGNSDGTELRGGRTRGRRQDDQGTDTRTAGSEGGGPKGTVHVGKYGRMPERSRGYGRDDGRIDQDHELRAYGRKSGKAYRIWLSPEARKYFDPILPADPDSMCEECKAGIREHQQGYCPRKGSKQKRISEPGQINKAARQRVPKRLAQHLSKAMRAGWEEVNERLNGGRT